MKLTRTAPLNTHTPTPTRTAPLTPTPQHTRTHLPTQAWNQGLERLTTRVAQALGAADRAVRAVADKLLVYAPGDFFVLHRDSEKEPGHFGSLVVQLPSSHTGGGVLRVVEAGGASREFDFGMAAGTSGTMCHFTAYFSDVQHAVSPVEGGHRLAIVFRLLWEEGGGGGGGGGVGAQHPVVHPTGTPVARAVAALGSWPRGSPPLVALALRQRYTPAALAAGGLSALKGPDAALCRVLQAANAVVPPGEQVALYPVLVTRVDSWTASTWDYGYGGRDSPGSDLEYADWEFEGSSTSAQWFDAAGARLATSACPPLEVPRDVASTEEIYECVR
jgi:hypothetical protein